MAELVVVLPVLILFAIGVMDYSRVFFRALIVANAARAGAEWAAFQPAGTPGTGIQGFAQLDGQEIGGLIVNTQQVCRCGDNVVSCSSSCAGYGPPRAYTQVTAVDTVALLIRYPGLPSRIGISRTATFRNSNN
ncbi:MAG TPA: TadE/TadG family type IV pilus assembly protein [Gemmatimonadaceae bacterium]